jgi:hypothetical protein
VRRLAPLACLLLLASPAAALEAGEAAPALAATDVRGRALAVPVRGRVTLLSFASPSTGEAAGDITRAVRVEHPELEIVSFIDLSGFPAFAHGFLAREMEQHHQDAVRETQAAFARAGKRAPEDLDAHIHIVPDFEAKSCERYGASDLRRRPLLVVVGADGRVAAVFDEALALAGVRAAVAAALGPGAPR